MGTNISEIWIKIFTRCRVQFIRRSSLFSAMNLPHRIQLSNRLLYTLDIIHADQCHEKYPQGTNMYVIKGIWRKRRMGQYTCIDIIHQGLTTLYAYQNAWCPRPLMGIYRLCLKIDEKVGHLFTLAESTQTNKMHFSVMKKTHKEQICL